MFQLWLHIQRGEPACLIRHMCTTRLMPAGMQLLHGTIFHCAVWKRQAPQLWVGAEHSIARPAA